jgi:hypothetical protein
MLPENWQSAEIGFQLLTNCCHYIIIIILLLLDYIIHLLNRN